MKKTEVNTDNYKITSSTIIEMFMAWEVGAMATVYPNNSKLCLISVEVCVGAHQVDRHGKRGRAFLGRIKSPAVRLRGVRDSAHGDRRQPNMGRWAETSQGSRIWRAGRGLASVLTAGHWFCGQHRLGSHTRSPAWWGRRILHFECEQVGL